MGFFCWPIRPRLGAYHDGELSPPIRTRIEAHLARCRTCAAESRALASLHAALRAETPEPPEAVWDAFWPQVRMRLQAAPEPEPAWWRAWRPVLARPRLALGSALAAAALAVLAVVAPWQRLEHHGPLTASAPTVAGGVPAAGPAPTYAVVQSVETADPQSSVMVYTNPESDVTVVWVFGLENTET
jgi:anti-sigma factor RsiW